MLLVDLIHSDHRWLLHVLPSRGTGEHYGRGSTRKLGPTSICKPAEEKPVALA